MSIRGSPKTTAGRSRHRRHARQLGPPLVRRPEQLNGLLDIRPSGAPPTAGLVGGQDWLRFSAEAPGQPVDLGGTVATEQRVGVLL